MINEKGSTPAPPPPAYGSSPHDTPYGPPPGQGYGYPSPQAYPNQQQGPQLYSTAVGGALPPGAPGTPGQSPYGTPGVMPQQGYPPPPGPPQQALSTGAAYQQQLFALCAAGNHDIQTKHGIAGIIGAIIFFPIGLICLFADVEKRCVRCGSRVG